MSQHGPTDRDPEPDSPGNRHIPPKLTMQLHGTPAARHRRDGPARPVEVVAATAHRETGELLHGPPAPPSPSAPHQHPLRVSGDPAPPLPAGPGRADGIQRDVPRRRGPVIRRPRVANPLACPGRVARNRRPAFRIRITARSSRHSVSSWYRRRSTCWPRSGRRHQACASGIITIPPAARRTVSPTRTPVSRRVAPATLAAATSSTCPDASSPSSA